MSSCWLPIDFRGLTLTVLSNLAGSKQASARLLARQSVRPDTMTIAALEAIASWSGKKQLGDHCVNTR